MIIGVPKETKVEEYRVSTPPTAAATLAQSGHTILVQTGAGLGAGFSDEDYVKAGATITDTADEVWNQAEMVYHVKEPTRSEYKYFRKGLILFTYLHLAPERELTMALLKSAVSAIAFETVQLPDGTKPLLDPMSAIAGRTAILVGAQYLGKMYGGNGLLIGGISGVPPTTVVILGGGVVGTNAAWMALSLGARVTIIDKNALRLKYLKEISQGLAETLIADPHNVANAVKEADILIGSVLVPGAKAPVIVTRNMVRTMKKGSVIVDVAIDQGGCIETSRPTTHADPIYIEEGVVHYCVTNMPGKYPQTSTVALSNATLPYALKLAKGFREAVLSDECLAKGVNTYNGYCTNEGVAKNLGLEYTPLSKVLK